MIPLSAIFRPALIAVLLATPAAYAARPDLLRGAIDLHCHSGPDLDPRSVNDIELAQLARAAGLRAVDDDRRRAAARQPPGQEGGLEGRGRHDQDLSRREIRRGLGRLRPV